MLHNTALLAEWLKAIGATSQDTYLLSIMLRSKYLHQAGSAASAAGKEAAQAPPEDTKEDTKVEDTHRPAADGRQSSYHSKFVVGTVESVVAAIEVLVAADPAKVASSAFAVYMTPNPRNLVAANRGALKKLLCEAVEACSANELAMVAPAEALTPLVTAHLQVAKFSRLVRSAAQQTCLSRFFIVDLDVPGAYDELMRELQEDQHIAIAWVIHTRGGYHIGIRADTTTEAQRKWLFKTLSLRPHPHQPKKHISAVHVADYSPLPGAFQAGHAVTFSTVSSRTMNTTPL